jgi:hypothetical protein
MAYHGRWNSPVWKALLSSCVVYVAPVNYADFGANCWCSVLLSPKLNDTFGASVWFAYLAWTVFLQGLLAASLYFLFRRATRLFVAPIVAAALFLFIGVPLSVVSVWLDARVVPFLYREGEGPAIDWQESCRVEHAHLLMPAAPRYGFLERSARAWMLSHATEEPMILLPEGCQSLAFSASKAGEDELKRIFRREPGFNIRWIHIGFRQALFDKHVPSNIGKTWTSEFGYQFTPTRVMFQRQYLPGGCVIYGLSPHESRDIPSESSASCPVLSGDSGSVGSLEGTAYSVSERRVEIASPARQEHAVGRHFQNWAGIRFSGRSFG